MTQSPLLIVLVTVHSSRPYVKNSSFSIHLFINIIFFLAWVFALLQQCLVIVFFIKYLNIPFSFQQQKYFRI